MSVNLHAPAIDVADITMSSLELVDYINSQRAEGEAELRHDTFLAKVPKVLGGDAQKFLGVYRGANGQDRPCYRFPKREACLMAMSYSYELQAKVFDRMTALEQERAAPPMPRLPQTLAQALRLAADQAEALELANQQLALAAPKVEFVDRYATSTGNKGIRETAKLLQANEREFVAWLEREDGGCMYRLAGQLTPRAPHLDAGRFVVKTGTSVHTEGGHAFNQAKFTPKGVTWIAGEWAKHRLLQREAA